MIIAAAFALSSCARKPPHIVNQHYSLNNIENLDIEDAHIVYINSNKKSDIIIRAYNTDQPRVNINKKTQTMYINDDDKTAIITVNKSAWNKVLIHHTDKVFINAPQHMTFNALQINDSHRVTVNASRQIHLNNLQLTNAGNVTIKGPVAANTLIVNGKTTLNPQQLRFDVLYQGNGVNANYGALARKQLTIFLAGNSNITLRGHLKTLKVNLYQNAHINARNLTVNKAFIKAHGNSFINLRVTNTLFMYSTKQAVIEYYGHPKIYRRVLSSSAGIPMSLRGLLAP